MVLLCVGSCASQAHHSLNDAEFVDWLSSGQGAAVLRKLGEPATLARNVGGEGGENLHGLAVVPSGVGDVFRPGSVTASALALRRFSDNANHASNHQLATAKAGRVAADRAALVRARQLRNRHVLQRARKQWLNVMHKHGSRIYAQQAARLNQYVARGTAAEAVSKVHRVLAHAVQKGQRVFAKVRSGYNVAKDTLLAIKRAPRSVSGMVAAFDKSARALKHSTKAVVAAHRTAMQHSSLAGRMYVKSIERGRKVAQMLDRKHKGRALMHTTKAVIGRWKASAAAARNSIGAGHKASAVGKQMFHLYASKGMQAPSSVNRLQRIVGHAYSKLGGSFAAVKHSAIGGAKAAAAGAATAGAAVVAKQGLLKKVAVVGGKVLGKTLMAAQMAHVAVESVKSYHKLSSQLRETGVVNHDAVVDLAFALPDLFLGHGTGRMVVNATRKIARKAKAACSKGTWNCVSSGARFAHRTTKKVGAFLQAASVSTVECTLSPKECIKKLVGRDGILRKVGGMAVDWFKENGKSMKKWWKDRKERKAFCMASAENRKQCKLEDTEAEANVVKGWEDYRQEHKLARIAYAPIKHVKRVGSWIKGLFTTKTNDEKTDEN